MISNIIINIEKHRYSERPMNQALARGKDRLADLAASLGLIQSRNWFADEARARLGRVPPVFIETGTYRADNTIKVARHFEEVHTIDISEMWSARAAERCARYRNITCHHGDSSEILPRLLEQIDRPAVIFLDAHFSGGTTGRGDVDVPLEAELKAIASRAFDDLVVIDDWNMAGKAGELGEEGNWMYEKMEYDWRHIDETLVEGALGRTPEALDIRDNRLIFVSRGAA